MKKQATYSRITVEELHQKTAEEKEFFLIDTLTRDHFDIDRTRWGVICGSSRFFKHLGMHLVYDPISIQVRIFADPA